MHAAKCQEAGVGQQNAFFLPGMCIQGRECETIDSSMHVCSERESPGSERDEAKRREASRCIMKCLKKIFLPSSFSSHSPPFFFQAGAWRGRQAWKGRSFKALEIAQRRMQRQGIRRAREMLEVC